eukprot:jgi/Bigna1/145383/aug1.98_g20091
MLRTQRCIHSRLQAFASCPSLSLLTAAGQQRRGLSVESNEGLPSTFVEGYHDPEIVRKMRYRPLGSRCVDKNGVPMEVSIVSIGASAFGGMYGTETVEDECVEILRESVKSGINLIDAAAWYGHGRAEEVLGKALQGIPREAYYLNTKVCRYNPSIMEMFDWSYDRTMRAIDEALERMGVDYLDSIQVHDPEFAPSIDLVVSSVFPAFEEAKRQGKVRQLGVTGYPLETLRAQIDGADEAGIEINTCLSYCHYTLHDTTLVSELVPYLQEKGVGLIGASPISMGLLSNRGPPAWHPAPTLLKQLAAQAAEYCVKNDVDIDWQGIEVKQYWEMLDKYAAVGEEGRSNGVDLRRDVERNGRSSDLT